MANSQSLVARNRVARRDDIFGEDCAGRVWGKISTRKPVGFSQVPRTASLIATLLDELEKAVNPGRVYLDLWLRAYGDCMLIIKDENSFAFSSGYINRNRGVRTWRERLRLIEKYNFIEIKAGSGQDIRYVLLIDPQYVLKTNAKAIEKAVGKPFFDEWLNTYKETRADFGMDKLVPASQEEEQERKKAAFAAITGQKENKQV